MNELEKDLTEISDHDISKAKESLAKIDRVKAVMCEILNMNGEGSFLYGMDVSHMEDGSLFLSVSIKDTKTGLIERPYIITSGQALETLIPIVQTITKKMVANRGRLRIERIAELTKELENLNGYREE